MSRKISSRKEGRARDTSKIIMVKLILVKNGTQMKRILAWMNKKRWLTLPSNPPRHRCSSPTSPMAPLLPLASWQRGIRYIYLIKSLMIMMMKATLDAQEDLFVLEKERNLELQGLLTKRDEMLSNLTKEASIAEATIEDKERELSYAKAVIIDLANAKEALELSVSSLTIFKIKNSKCNLKNARTPPPHP
jgi:hypothetical protein